MGLNFTSTNPSLRLVSSLMQTGYVAWPDCLRTFGLLGAVASASTVHFGRPLPVIVKVQPWGGVPAAALSKFRVSAMAFPSTNNASNTAARSTFIAEGRDGRVAVKQI